MKSVKNIFNWLIFLCLSIGSAFAQGYYDNALRFGQNSIFGSAKSMGMGGVQMAMGADATAQGTNPAAPGLMRKSEIQFSLMPILNTSQNSFEGSDVEASKSRAPIGSFSLALCSPKDDIEPGSFRGGTFTISYNRMAVFDRKSNWEGTTPVFSGTGGIVDNSIIDYYLSQVNTPGLFPSDVIGNPNSPAELNLFYDSFVLDEDSAKNFTSFIPKGDVTKRGAWNQTLSQGSWNFGYSANFNDKIYIGASFGYVTSSFNLDLNYEETLINVLADPNSSNNAYFQQFRGFNFNVQKSIKQTMSGINGNVGILGKINDNFRLAASIQLPTLLNGNEVFDAKMNANYNNIDYWYNDLLPEADRITLGAESSSLKFPDDFNWKLRIPAKYRFGATYVAGKAGMFGIDLEYTDLSQTKLTEGDGNYNFGPENNVIKNQYKSTLNIKAGGELRFEDLRFRAGYAYMPGALKSGSEFKNNAHSDAHYITGGMGGRYETWYWDAALVYGFWSTRYNYLPAIMPDVVSEVSSTQLRLGIGFYY
jgi:hypothetical protein